MVETKKDRNLYIILNEKEQKDLLNYLELKLR